MGQSRLFEPLKLGNVELGHRVVMAPLTRYRADNQHVPLDMVIKYYRQRASVPGTLLISEATTISPKAIGHTNAPGIWSPDQIEEWKLVVNAVHDRKCLMYLQLWAHGVKADPESLKTAEGGPYPVVAPSAIPLTPVEAGGVIPHALTREEIKVYIEEYATAAKNAMAAGFDGVELHSANGYLMDQFLHDVANQRTDEYGGSVENRARFGLEVTKAVIAAVGDSKKVAIRLSPWSNFEGKTMENPVPQFMYFISQLKTFGLSYLHLQETRKSGDSANGVYDALTSRNDAYIEEWGRETPIILAGGFTPEIATQMVDKIRKDFNVCIAFGRSFISTPDLPFRIKQGIAPNAFDRTTFYAVMSAAGYADYAFSPEYLAQEVA